MLGQTIFQADRSLDMPRHLPVARLVTERFLIRFVMYFNTGHRYLKAVVNIKGDTPPAASKIDNLIRLIQPINLKQPV
ncbi:hypothetical protein D3C77_663030 [compost metagenome]